MSGASRPGGVGALPRRRQGARPELFPVRHHARAARLSAISARRPEEGRDAEACPRFGLPVADEVGQPGHLLRADGPLHQVIERLRPGAAEAGNIVHVDGRVLGRHGGIINYTIGQRQGIGVAAAGAALRAEARCRAREVVVGPRECLRTRRIELRDMNWLGDEPLRTSPGAVKDILARIRSSGSLQPATLLSLACGGSGSISPRARMAYRPGRLACFTRRVSGGERLLGGGWIRSAEPASMREVIAHAMSPRGEPLAAGPRERAGALMPASRDHRSPL